MPAVPRNSRARAEAAGHRRGFAAARRQCRLLGRREEAQRDLSDGDAGAAPRDPRRDRQRPRHRRAEDGGRRRQRAARPRPRDVADHPLPAPARTMSSRTTCMCCRAAASSSPATRSSRSSSRPRDTPTWSRRLPHDWQPRGLVMSVDIASIGPYIRQFAAARSLLPGAGFAWLDAKRDAAIKRFAQQRISDPEGGGVEVHESQSAGANRIPQCCGAIATSPHESGARALSTDAGLPPRRLRERPISARSVGSGSCA